MPNYVYICTDPQCGFVDEIIEVHAMTKEEDDARPDQDRPVCSRCGQSMKRDKELKLPRVPSVYCDSGARAASARPQASASSL